MLQIIIIALTFAFTISSPVEDTRIIGGQQANDGEFPYQVSLRQLNTSNSHFCGGSIIGPQWILTAAHCVFRESAGNVISVVGTNYLNSGGFAYGFDRIVVHPNYNPQNNINDIALLQVRGSIALNAKVQTIALATNPTPGGLGLVLSGWGLTSYPSNTFPNALQSISLRSISLQQCQQLLPGYPVYSTNICTHLNRGQGACKGDSGGPLVFGSTQTGIVSWGIPCALGNPDVFTSVPSYRTWIRQITGI